MKTRRKVKLFDICRMTPLGQNFLRELTQRHVVQEEGHSGNASSFSLRNPGCLERLRWSAERVGSEGNRLTWSESPEYDFLSY